MAAGTGGHVFPALAIAEVMRERKITVAWLGTHSGMENRILQDKNIPLHKITVSGLRGSSLARLLTAPFMLLKAFIESWRVIKKIQPDFVLGMGGFVCGPAGVASRIIGIPLYIHEQNAVAGLTNKMLAPFSVKVFEGFPDTFPQRKNALFVGNPLRAEFSKAGVAKRTLKSAQQPIRILILGGSQGALAINEVIPEFIAQANDHFELETLHQVGANKLESTTACYGKCEVELADSHRLLPFIEDMPAAYAWADIVICRSGASTVSEIAAVGLPAIFIPYPHHKDQQQKLNALWLVKAGAARIIEQKDLTASSLRIEVESLTADPATLANMSERAKTKAVFDASQRIADTCLEVLHAA